jgi:hypothetical protein
MNDIKVQGAKTIEGFALTHGEVGQVFFTNKESGFLNVLAGHHNRKIKTKTITTLEGSVREPIVGHITKVTIIE